MTVANVRRDGAQRRRRGEGQPRRRTARPHTGTQPPRRQDHRHRTPRPRPGRRDRPRRAHSRQDDQRRRPARRQRRGPRLGSRVVRSRLRAGRHVVRRPRLARRPRNPKTRQSAAGPISVLLVVVYFVSFAAIGSPDTAWALRHLVGFPSPPPSPCPPASPWEPCHGGSRPSPPALTLAAIAGLVVLGGRIYTAAVLHSGPTLKLREHLAQRRRTCRPASAAKAPTNVERHSPTTAKKTRSAFPPWSKESWSQARAGGLAIIVTNDLIIGVAVGASGFVVIDRVTKAWRQPPPADPRKVTGSRGRRRQSSQPRGTSMSGVRWRLDAP